MAKFALICKLMLKTSFSPIWKQPKRKQPCSPLPCFPSQKIVSSCSSISGSQNRLPTTSGQSDPYILYHSECSMNFMSCKTPSKNDHLDNEDILYLCIYNEPSDFFTRLRSPSEVGQIQQSGLEVWFILTWVVISFRNSTFVFVENNRFNRRFYRRVIIWYEKFWCYSN